MPSLKGKISLTVLGCLMLSYFSNNAAIERYVQSEITGITESALLNGYRDIVFFKDNFIAVGTDGRIDRISRSGEVVAVDSSCSVNLNCVFANDTLLIAAGDHGTILYSLDEKSFNRVESGTDKNIYTITSKNGVLLAGLENGLILGSQGGQFWNTHHTGATGTILSMSATDAFFIGVTDAGEIVKSGDGFEWQILDYNKEYAEYNPYANFKKIVTTQNRIVIIGTHKDGSPCILFSSLGHVWAEREAFYYDEQEMIRYLIEQPNDITYDSIRDQFILACENGVLFCLPACTKCNEYTKISEEHLCTLFYVENMLCVGGENFAVFVQKF